MASQKQLDALARGRATRAANKAAQQQRTTALAVRAPTYATRVVPPQSLQLPAYYGALDASPPAARAPRKQSATTKVKRTVRKGASSIKKAFKTKGGTAVIVTAVAALAAGAVLTGEGLVKDSVASAGFLAAGLGALAFGAPKVGIAMLAIGVFEGVQAGVSYADAYRGRLLESNGTAGQPADART